MQDAKRSVLGVEEWARRCPYQCGDHRVTVAAPQWRTQSPPSSTSPKGAPTPKGSAQSGHSTARENDFDITVTTVPIADDSPFRSGASAMSLNVVHHFEKGGTAVVKLGKKPDTTPHLEWAWLKIAVVQVDPPVTNTPMA